MNRIIGWWRRRRKLTMTEDEWLVWLQRELEKRGIYGSSNVQSTVDRQLRIIYLWPPHDRQTH